MEKIHVNEFIAENLNKMAKMSIQQLKKLLKKITARRNPDDAHTIKTIRALIEKKKKEYPVIAHQLAQKKFNALQAKKQAGDKSSPAVPR